jgi:hypothetical protein
VPVHLRSGDGLLAPSMGSFIGCNFGSQPPDCRRKVLEGAHIQKLWTKGNNGVPLWCTRRHLDNNRITGTLPKEWSAMAQLTFLYAPVSVDLMPSVCCCCGPSQHELGQLVVMHAVHTPVLAPSSCVCVSNQL